MKRVVAIFSMALMTVLTGCAHHDIIKPDANSPEDVAFSKTLDSIDSIIEGFYYYDFNDSIILPALEFYQQITDNITPINITSWPSGTYIWKVIANGKVAETGKWILSH